MTPPIDALPLAYRLVLVVEDSDVQRAHAVSVTKEMGAPQVLEAADGAEALEVLRNHPNVDLVLCDLEMPGMDGVSLIGEIAARGYRPDVVIVSAQDASVLHSVRLLALTYGLSTPGIIPKPLEADALTRLITAPPQAVKPPTTPLPVYLDAQAIRKGIENNEFICFFQPQITMQDRSLQGVEALVRWRHPSIGLLGPGAFLPQAEADTNLMSDLTLALLAYVAEQWKAWVHRGLETHISVNLSARSINSVGFADRLLEAVTKLGIPVSALLFEVTESASVSDLVQTLSNLARLRMRGFKLSIDDFGTGFATFEQLERIPFTELKIDQSITRELPDSKRHMVLAKHMLQMAKELDLSTVAEGIETTSSWSALKEMGCTLGQGFLIARPMPGEQVPTWVVQDLPRLSHAGVIP